MNDATVSLMVVLECSPGCGLGKAVWHEASVQERCECTALGFYCTGECMS